MPSTTALDRERLQWTNTEIVNKHVLLLRTQLFKAAVGKKKETNLHRRKKVNTEGRHERSKWKEKKQGIQTRKKKIRKKARHNEDRKEIKADRRDKEDNSVVSEYEID